MGFLLMLNTLPVDIFENNVFYYLKGQDLYNLSLLNRGFRERLNPIRTLGKLGVRPGSMWPNLQLDFSTEYQKKNRFEPPYALLVDSSKVQESLPELAKIKWGFPEISVNSPSFPQIYRYLPKAGNVSLLVIEQGGYIDLGKSLQSNIVNELMFNSGDKVKGQHVFDILSNLKYMTKLKRISQVYELDRNFALAYQKHLPGSQVEDLELETNCMDDKFVQILAQGLPGTKVKRLSLHWNEIGDIGVEAISAVLPKTQIEVLDLGRNQIEGRGIKALADVLPSCKVKELQLTENSMSPDDMNEIFKIIHLSNLEIFHFYDPVTQEGLELLSKNLPHSKLKRSTLEITPDMIEKFLEAVSRSKLEEFHIRTREGDAVCLQLASNIENLTVRALQLSNAQITAPGLGLLLSQLIKIDLEELDLSDNPIGNDGLKLLSLYLPQTRVKKLKLNRANFTDEGVLALAKCLKETKLEWLEIRCYETSNTAIIELIESLPRRMKYLDARFSRTVDQQAVGRLVLDYPNTTIFY
ncbi:hypothetical protein HK103_002373 [Boothiomyces macroporosus]|uniref:F-box domain-containing protein n=1 Tax=Boothiomyces macroporosus TaxID=261099 RepID=A0AAD5U9G7_9FUNG|nr:hypothetical protein HK103_002373 [Boothiomyces macroporosus]